MTPVVLALDQGSSSSRALAIDAAGRVLARAQIPLRTHSPRKGWFEHDPLELALGQEKALAQVLGRLPRAAPILGLGLACQRSTVIFWDRTTGRPAGRALSWQDGRAAADIPSLAADQRDVHRRTGLYLTPYYSAPKIRWSLARDERLKRLLDQGRLLCGPVSTFLAWRLTKGEVFCADPTMAQRMLLYNIAAGDWDEDLLKLFAVPRDILPRLVPSAGVWGQAFVGGRSLPLLAALGDQQAAALGLGAWKPGACVANYGTGAFILFNAGAASAGVPGLLTSVAWSGRGERRFFLEGTVHAAATAFDWLRDNFGLLRGAADIDRLCRESSERIWALPAIGGLGAPRWDYVTRTAFFGLSSRTRSADMVRAVAEGIAFLMADIVERLRQAGHAPASMLAAGGLSQADFLMRFQADLVGLPLIRSGEQEATAMGIAELAFQAAGTALRRPRGARARTFQPSLERARAEVLLKAWEAFVAAQASLSRDPALQAAGT